MNRPEARPSARDGPAQPVTVDHRLLVRYRVMAFTTATLLIVLVFAGIPLQFAAGRPEVVNVVGTIHGFLYLIYLYVAFELTRKLAVPKWQMALVLLAGTVPFCAFVAERKMTKRFEALTKEPPPSAGRGGGGRWKAHAASIRGRWFSRRALLLHLEVAIVAPGCVAAGWWQATRALAGNELSWVYSVEWPVFALLAIAGWWHLVHEDPAAYRARRLRPPPDDVAPDKAGAPPPAATLGREEITVEIGIARLATALAALVGIEFGLGIVALLSLSVGRPAGWLPERGEAVYLVHAVLGAVIGLGAVAFLIGVRLSSRTDRVVGWMGLLGVALAGVGGLLTEAQSLVRFLGMALMFVGPVIAGLAYLIPAMYRLQHKESPSEAAQEAPA